MTNNLSSENIIINKYLNKLNQNKLGTFNFENDAAYLNVPKNYKITFGQMNKKKKTLIDHRYIAYKKLKKKFNF